MKPPLFFFFLISLIVPFHAVASDFALLDSPQSFTIFNQFEQPLVESEKKGLLPFCPLQILQTDARLGDQITRAMQCSYDQKTYYLLKDGQGAIIGNKGQLHVLKGCALVGDTVEIVKEGVVAIFGKSLVSSVSRLALPIGTRLVVLFRYGNAYYSLQTSPARRYGWVGASSRDSWKRVKQAAPIIDVSITEALSAQLRQRIASANGSYQTFFERFNSSVGQRKSVPKWSEEGTTPLSWSLSEPYGHTGELDASTEYIIKDLREILIGKSFSVRCEKGRIVIVSTGARLQ
jgi:hypothetical protein